jgi:hypothetical protein
MRKLAIAFVVLGMALMAVPSFAATAVTADEPNMGVQGQGSPSRSNDCPGTIVWDTGLFDEYTVPTGCSSAGSAGCFVAAINDGAFPTDGRRMADDFEVNEPTSITAVKIWARYSASGNAYHLATPGSVHGFCVKFYEQDAAALWCPDGTIAGEDAIGTIAYDQYASTFTEYEITTGVPRNWNYCINLPSAFVAQPGKVYWVSVSADFDFTTYDDPATPAVDDGVTQFFNRTYIGGYDPYCEVSWWDTWNTPNTNWNALSVALNIPCWAGWNLGFVLYSGEVPPEMGACCIQGTACFQATDADCSGNWYAGVPCVPNDPCPPVPTETKSWGDIKNIYSR